MNPDPNVIEVVFPPAPDTTRAPKLKPQAPALPGVDQDAAAELAGELDAQGKLRAAFRASLFVLGKSEHRRRPLTPAQKAARRAAGRRARAARRVTRAAA